MKKIAIPTILTATILIAASFAFMPIQKAEESADTNGIREMQGKTSSL